MNGLFEEIFGAGQKLVNDVTKTGTQVVKTGQQAVKDNGASLAEELIRSTAFSEVLDKVEEKAKAGATEAVKAEAGKNALSLGMLAIATGALGGAILRGKAGKLAALGIGALAVSRILAAQAPSPVAAAPQKPKALGAYRRKLRWQDI